MAKYGGIQVMSELGYFSYNTPTVSANMLKKSQTDKLFLADFHVSGFTPDSFTNTFSNIVYCPYCSAVFSTSYYKYKTCQFCRNEPLFYKGPLYVRFKVDEESFTTASLLNGLLPIKLYSEYFKYDWDYKLNMVLNRSVLGIMQNYSNGEYFGFAAIIPPKKDKLGIIDSKLMCLNDMQASMLEKACVLYKNVCQKSLRRKALRDKGYNNVNTFIDYYQQYQCSIEHDRAERFLKYINLTKFGLSKIKEKAIYENISKDYNFSEDDMESEE